MTNCPKCGRPVEEEPVCPSCGQTLGAAPADVPAPVAAASASATGPRRPPRSLPLIAFAACGVGSLVLLASAMRSTSAPPPMSPATEAPMEAAGVARPQTTIARASATTAPAPGTLSASRSTSAARWIVSKPSRREYGSANSILFELAADDDVAVWHNRVRPVLAVRCVAKTPDVFVMTYSAASVERETRLHTVEMTFDDDKAVSQMWEHSVDHDALFAPDGAALARELAGARRMSFAFTPFNASPVVARFSVAGLGKHLASAAKTCG